MMRLELLTGDVLLFTERIRRGGRGQVGKRKGELNRSLNCFALG